MLYKYLLSYIVLLLLPIVIIGIVSYQHYESALMDQVKTNHIQLLNKARSEIDVKWQEMNRIAMEIASDPDLRPSMMEDRIHHVSQVKKRLNYMVANGFIHNIILYYPEHELLYGSTTTFTPKVFAESYYRYPDWPMEQMIDDLTNLKQVKLRPAETVISNELSGDRALTYMIPIPFNSSKPLGVVMFIIDETTIVELLKDVSPSYTSNVLIYDQQGQSITSIHRNNDLIPEDLIIRMIQEGALFEKVVVPETGEKMIVTSVTSPSTNWHYLSLISEESLTAVLDKVRDRAVLSLVIVLIIGGLAVYGLMMVNYRPIDRLFRTMNQQIKDSKEAVKSQLVLQWIKGHMAQEEWRIQAERAGIQWNGHSTFVIKLRFRYVNQSQSENGIPLRLNEIESICRQYYSCYGTELMHDEEWVMICHERIENMESREVNLKQLRSELEQAFHLQATVGVGNSYARWEQIGQSYLEASAALDYRFVKGHGTLLFFRNTAAQDEVENWYPYVQMEQLRYALQHGQIATFERIVRQLVAQIEENQPSLHTVRMFGYELVHLVVHTFSEDGAGRSKINNNLPDVEQFESLPELLSVVIEFAAEVCEEWSERQSVKPAFKQQLNTYIEEHYTDSQFSVQSMAEHFSISSSYLKRYYKEHTGRTITDYLIRLRLDMAKQLLRDTDQPLKDIVIQIGYMDVSSFIRKFKQLEGITPGEFRNEQQM